MEVEKMNNGKKHFDFSEVRIVPAAVYFKAK